MNKKDLVPHGEREGENEGELFIGKEILLHFPLNRGIIQWQKQNPTTTLSQDIYNFKLTQ